MQAPQIYQLYIILAWKHIYSCNFINDSMCFYQFWGIFFQYRCYYEICQPLKSHLSNHIAKPHSYKSSRQKCTQQTDINTTDEFLSIGIFSSCLIMLPWIPSRPGCPFIPLGPGIPSGPGFPHSPLSPLKLNNYTGFAKRCE